jgi:post-segregation antitoxin (ccd killing protein)
MHMTRLNIYVPDDLAERAKKAGLNISGLTQDAIRKALEADSTDGWLASLRPVSPKTSHGHVLEALDAARDEPTTHHGRSDG